MTSAKPQTPPVETIKPASVKPTPTQPTEPPLPMFKEVGKAAGLNYEWKIGGKRPLNILQTIGNGCAFLDYNHDGNLDILLVGERLALYQGDGAGKFADVSKETGLDIFKEHFLGCAVGDYDNDGSDDLYISGWRCGVLLHNENGKFVDVTDALGIEPQPWGSSCGFADLDADGYLDLYITNYVTFGPDTEPQLCTFNGRLTGCGPVNYNSEKNVLYRNLGGKRFKDVSKNWKVRGSGNGLGVAFADFNRSGRMSFVVANDLMPANLYVNQGKGKLKDQGQDAGISLDETGETYAGMGVDWGDIDNDGRPDFYISNFRDEMKCLYHNEDYGVFQLVTEQTGVDKPTRPYVGWGCKFLDADNDGWLDLLLAHGHVQDNIDKYEKTTYRQPTLFLHNQGGERPIFKDLTRAS
ncbi:VCBS repeat-containing protein, partial [Nostoc sp. CHAB 5824]|nr:VCBS repeat-containing protein [Nostoc sp. CHAB 5824]